MKNHVLVTIWNKDYRLATEDSQDYSEKLAQNLNERLRKMVLGTSELTHLDGAMLVALDCLDEATKTRQSIDNIRSQIKEYVDEAEQAKKQADSANKELTYLRDKVAQLEKEIALRKQLTPSPAEILGNQPAQPQTKPNQTVQTPQQNTNRPFTSLNLNQNNQNGLKGYNK